MYDRASLCTSEQQKCDPNWHHKYDNRDKTHNLDAQVYISALNVFWHCLCGEFSITKIFTDLFCENPNTDSKLYL